MLQQRDQGTSGTKAALARRLESGDCTRLARLSCWLSAEDNIASLLQLKNQGDRSLSRKKGRSAEPRPAPPVIHLLMQSLSVLDGKANPQTQ